MEREDCRGMPRLGCLESLGGYMCLKARVWGENVAQPECLHKASGYQHGSSWVWCTHPQSQHKGHRSCKIKVSVKLDYRAPSIQEAEAGRL